jgi:uncharacterized membrane protein
VSFFAFLFVFPLLLIWGEKRISIIQWISPIILCYAVGLLLANVPGLNLDTSIATTVSEIAVPLAIPLLLFSTNIRQWLKGARGAVISFGLCILAVAISATLAAFLFSDKLTDSWKLSGMVMGVYTGGTPNMSAIGLSLDVPEEVFILLNASDLVWGALYLLFLMTLAKPLLGRFLPRYHANDQQSDNESSSSFGDLRLLQKMATVGLFVCLAALILAASVGLSLALFGEMKAVVIILTVTTLGIALSFNKRIHEKPGSYELGEYFLLVFCLALGSLADVSALVGSASQTLYFTGFVMVGAISLHILFAYFAKIDRDTVIITSVAGIYGPAFVGPIAKVLDNKAIVLTGMTTGLVGYAVGNYLGVGLAHLLKMWLQ